MMATPGQDTALPSALATHAASACRSLWDVALLWVTSLNVTLKTCRESSLIDYPGST